MKEIKADLHYHGPIGMQYLWLCKQGYKDKIILKEIADSCFRRGIGMCAIVSESENPVICGYSVEDRFGYLEKEIKELPNDYGAGTLGSNIIVIKHNSDELYILNGQTVITDNNGKRIDYLVIGSNNLPNLMPLRETLRESYGSGLINIAEHPFALSHHGIGRKNLNKYLNFFDAVEGHNSQFILPESFFYLPLIHGYSRKINKLAREYSEQMQIPWIAVSDGHRIVDAGISYITLDFDESELKSEEKLFSGLKNRIRQNEFRAHCHYPDLKSWADWTLKFKAGTDKKFGFLWKYL